MNDLYREYAKRSIKDAAWLSREVADDCGLVVPDEMVMQFAVMLYQHRVQEWKMKQAKAEQQSQYPDDPGGGVF